MFPIIPFISEYLWQNAVRELDKNAAESVALNGYNICEFKVKDDNFTRSTDIVRNIFAMVGKLRNENQIKVKQPLKTLYINGNNEVAKAVDLYKDIIENELNIKNVVLEKDNSKFNDEFLSLDFRRAGAVLKGDVQKVKNYLLQADAVEMQKMVEGFKKNSVDVNEFKGLDASLFVLSTKPKKDYVISNDNDITVVLDITIDRDLMLEGLSRELIRSAQVLRKQANFNVEDRIYVQFETESADLKEILAKYSGKIKSELLALEIKPLAKPEISETVEIGEEKITIKMAR